VKVPPSRRNSRTEYLTCLTMLYCPVYQPPAKPQLRQINHFYGRKRNTCDPVRPPPATQSLPSLSSDFPRQSRPVLSLEDSPLPPSLASRRFQVLSNGDATAYLTTRAADLSASTRYPRRVQATGRMATPGLDEVMAFLTDHGFAGAASALRDDVLARTAAGDAGRANALDPQLPPLRMPGSASGGGDGGTPAPASPRSSSGSASSSAFVSMSSSPSGTRGTRHCLRSV
jgi:hypothetical protein